MGSARLRVTVLRIYLREKTSNIQKNHPFRKESRSLKNLLKPPKNHHPHHPNRLSR